jgi:hypothetical protein
VFDPDELVAVVVHLPDLLRGQTITVSCIAVP